MLYKDFSKKIRSVVAIHNVSQLRFLFGRDDRIRTCGIMVPNHERTASPSFPKARAKKCDKALIHLCFSVLLLYNKSLKIAIDIHYFVHKMCTFLNVLCTQLVHTKTNRKEQNIPHHFKSRNDVGYLWSSNINYHTFLILFGRI